MTCDSFLQSFRHVPLLPLLWCQLVVGCDPHTTELQKNFCVRTPVKSFVVVRKSWLANASGLLCFEPEAVILLFPERSALMYVVVHTLNCCWLV